MKIVLNEIELIDIMAAHLKSQGFNVRNCAITVKALAKHLGKGKGYDTRLEVMVTEIPPSEPAPEAPQEPAEPLAHTGPIFEEDYP